MAFLRFSIGGVLILPLRDSSRLSVLSSQEGSLFIPLSIKDSQKRSYLYLGGRMDGCNGW